MKRTWSLYLLLLFLLCSCCACNAEENKPTEQNLSEIKYELNELPIETLNLQDGEELKVLDAMDGQLLLSRYSEYREEDSNYSELGYCAYTKSIDMYDISKGIIVYTINLPERQYVLDASFIERDVFACVTVATGRQYATDYHIFLYQGVMTEIASGLCFQSGYDAPEVVSLGNGKFAYSYHDCDTDNFGVNVCTTQGNIIKMIALKSNANTEHLGTSLSGNGSMFAYYAIADGKRVIYIGNSSKITHRITPPDSERIFGYSILNDKMLLTASVQDGKSEKYALLVKDFYGNTIASYPHQLLYRLESNDDNIVLGIDDNYSPHCVYLSDSNINVQKIDAPTDSVCFRNMKDGVFIFDYHNCIKIMSILM